VKSSRSQSTAFTATDTTDTVAVNQTATVQFLSGSASSLIFSSQPSSEGVSGVAFPLQPVISVADSLGNVQTLSTALVTLEVATDNLCISINSSGVLANPSSQAVSGIAEFSGVSFDKVGTYYLKASGSGLTSACSSAIVISQAPPQPLVSCDSLTASGYTFDPSTERAANGVNCAPNELLFYSRSQGATVPVCVTVDCGPQARVCREISKSARSMDFYCASQ
jgi:hypothetical protein